MLLQTYIDQYLSRTKKSEEIYYKAEKILPGGVAGGGGYLAPRPIYVKSARGGYFHDIDGNSYIDVLLGGFLDILGHSPECVINAVQEKLDKGTSYMLFNETGIELAATIRKHQPHAEMLRFVNTGSEATLTAIRIARGFTGKNKIAKAEGGYNGQHDYVLISGATKQAGSAEKPEPKAETAGIPNFIERETVVIPWNNAEAAVEMIEQNAEDLAAILIEPYPGFGMGSLEPEPGFLEVLRDTATKNNILLIYDEVATGFRVGGLKGAAFTTGIAPDISCYGKVIGGGFPIGAVGGRRDVFMETLSPSAEPSKKVFQSGSFSGNIISMTAGLATLKELEKLDYTYIDGLADQIKKGITVAAMDNGFDIQVSGNGSIFYPHFNPAPVRNMRDKVNDNAELNRTFSMGMIANGIYLAPAHPGATCFAHTEDDIDYIIKTGSKILEQMRAETGL